MKKVVTRHWPLIGIIFLCLIVAVYLLKSGTDEGVEEPMKVEFSLEEGLKLKDIHYTQNNPDDGSKWVLDAKEVKVSRDRQVISFKEFRLELNPENRPSIELEGNQGVLNKSSGEILIQGNVRGTTANGYTIATEALLYQQKEGCLKTDTPVKITGPFFRVTGQGLSFNLNHETVKLMSGVTTMLNRDITRL
ncbi:LPS export ABC transporter periplasmic protein LptC [Thermodesulfobacteriota bacterium]